MNRFCFVFCILLLVSLFDGETTAIASSKQTQSQPDDLSRFETLIDLAEKTGINNPEQAIEFATEALSIGERKQDSKMIARAQLILASVHFDAQNFSKSVEYAKLCEPFFEKSNDVETLATLYNLFSTLFFYLGNVEMSDMYSDKSIELAEKHHILDVLFKQYYNRGAISFYRGDYFSSMEFAFKALDIAKKDYQPFNMAHCYELLGSISHKILEYRKALNYHNLSRKIYSPDGDKLFFGRNYFNTATIYKDLNQLDSARLCYYKSLDFFRETESAEGLAIAYTGLAIYYQMEGKLDSAQLFIGKGLKAALISESTKDLFHFYNTAGDISFQQGRFQNALDHYKKALKWALQNGNKEAESIVKQNISNYYSTTGHFDSAYHYLSQSYTLKDSINRINEVQKRAYTFAEHSVKEQLAKKTAAEQMQRRLWWVIMSLCVVVIVILSIFLRLMSVRQKKIESINTELNKYKSNLEHTLQDKTRELQLSEQLILNLSNNLPNGAIFRYAFDNEHEGKTLFVSSGWEDLTGQPVEETKDSIFFFQNRIHPEDSRELLKALTFAIRNRSVLDKVYRFYKNSAEIRWFHVRAAAIPGNNGLTYLDGYQVDETEQKHFEQELITAKNKAEESDKLKSAFLANMSHEIRTPMNAIIGFSAMLTNTRLSPERLVSYLELIQDNCQRLLRLIDDIVDISKIEAGQLNLRLKTVPLSEVMIDVRDHFGPIIETGYPHVELWIDDGLLNSTLTVHTDAFRLKQIFMHLIENALKFTEKGFVRCGLLHDRSDAEHFYVMDTGIGISHENQEIIFQSFRKLDQYSGGTGLGLSIVRRVLLQMGGSIWVESELGVGSTFHFTLPLKND